MDFRGRLARERIHAPAVRTQPPQGGFVMPAWDSIPGPLEARTPSRPKPPKLVRPRRGRLCNASLGFQPQAERTGDPLWQPEILHLP
jgi:hypothetical protein